MRSKLEYHRALPRAAVCLVSSSACVAMHLPCNCSGIVDEAGLLRQTRNEASTNGRDYGSIVSTRADDKKEKKALSQRWLVVVTSTSLAVGDSE
ncbi:hypothetical protein BC567DRAFT_894 [Phyllosticta citribraziliensis]